MSRFRITPIGTCRIHTPLRRAAPRYPIEVDNRRNYGFVHTSEEALQLVKFLQGDKQLQPQVAPLVARDADLARYEAEEWQPSDLHIVEISSSKRITCGSDAVQSNYLDHHFADFFASKGRTKTFWNLVKRAHRRDLIHFLRQERTYRLLSLEERELLAGLQLEQQSFKAIKSDMAEIVERLGKERLLFVTHVNVTTPDGELVPSRDRLIRWVRMAAEQLEVPVFDPTPSMRAFGQENALEHGGLDLTHYTPAYYDIVYEEMHRAHVASMMGTSTGVESSESPGEQAARTATHLEAMLELGDFFPTSRDVHAAVAASPDALPLIELRGLIRLRIGDFPGAVADLTRRGDDRALSQSMRVGLVEALNATGDPAGALRVAENLLADEYESASMYRAAAEAAQRIGKTVQAIAYEKQAFRADRSDLSPALNALVLLAKQGSPDERSAWRAEVLENIETSANGAFEVCVWAIEHTDEELFAAALKSAARLEKGGTIDLFEDAYNAGMYRAAAHVVPVVSALGRVARSLSDRRNAVIAGLIDKARCVFENGRSAEAHEIANAILALEDVNSSQIPTMKLAREARRLMKVMSQQIRATIRDAYKQKNTAEVLRIGEAAGDLLPTLPDVAVVFARSLHLADRTDEAVSVIVKARLQNSDSFMVTYWAARLAAIAGDYGTALEMYGALRRSDDPQVSTISAELERFFTGVEGRAAKDLRNLIHTGRFAAAVRLAALLKREVGAAERVERELRRLYSSLRDLVSSGQFDEAVRLATLIERELGADSRVERELRRIYNSLRKRLKAIDAGEGESDEREPILRQLLTVRPADVLVLRWLAREMMRQLRFMEAAEVWARLLALVPTDDTAALHHERCVKMAERRVTVSSSDLDAVA